MKILEMKILEQMKNILWFYYIFDITSFYKGVACKIYIMLRYIKSDKMGNPKKKIKQKVIVLQESGLWPWVKICQYRNIA